MACLSKQNYKEVTLKNVSLLEVVQACHPLLFPTGKKTNPTLTGVLLLTALDGKSTRRFTDKLADSL